MNKVADKNFKEKDFEEKKEYFEVLSQWKDEEIYTSFVGHFQEEDFSSEGQKTMKTGRVRHIVSAFLGTRTHFRF